MTICAVLRLASEAVMVTLDVPTATAVMVSVDHADRNGDLRRLTSLDSAS